MAARTAAVAKEHQLVDQIAKMTCSRAGSSIVPASQQPRVLPGIRQSSPSEQPRTTIDPCSCQPRRRCTLSTHLTSIDSITSSCSTKSFSADSKISSNCCCENLG
jgi:hypothetical protein